MVRRIAVACIVVFAAGFAAKAPAAGDLARQTPIIVSLQMGSAKDSLKFFPDSFSFETGKLYKMVITTEAKDGHYFTGPDLMQAVYTRKVMVLSRDNQSLGELKGLFTTIEAYAGGVLEWWFVPVRTGSFEFWCSTHKDKGMKGVVNVK
jgi:uncharacterized cupredoxin-like copper-binding protein